MGMALFQEEILSIIAKLTYLLESSQPSNFACQNSIQEIRNLVIASFAQEVKMPPIDI